MRVVHPPSPYLPPEAPRSGMNPWLVRLPILAMTGFVLLTLILVIAVGTVQIVYANRIFPNVWANGLNLGSKTPAEAVQALEASFATHESAVFTFTDGDRFWQASAEGLGVRLDAETTVAQAFAVGHGAGFVNNITDQVLAWLNGEAVSPLIRYDQASAVAFLNGLARDIDRPASDATLVINGTDVQARQGSPGRRLDVNATLSRLDAAIFYLQPGGQIPLVIEEIQPLALDTSVAAAKARAALVAPVTLVADDGRGGTLGPWTLPVEQIQSLLRVEQFTNVDGLQHTDVSVDLEVFRPQLEALAQGLVMGSQNGRFHFDESTRQLLNIVPAVRGRTLNVEATLERLREAIFSPTTRVVPMVFDYTDPAYPDTITAAELGITELISEGVTYYTGSTEARRTNINTAVSRFDGLIIGPGEEFSFNRYVGDISPEEGYVEGAVIVGNQTVPGLGGGVCQVSTTAFRAAFYAGFPITERNAHSYRVGYYENGDPEGVGMDAAIFTPDLDFRFINDTDYHLLIVAFVNTARNSVHFRFYSTNPGRTVTREPAEIVNEQPPGPTQYIVNSDLTSGQQLQVDWAVGGAFVRIPRVIRDLNGNELRREYIATQYQPWGAVIQVPPGDPRLG